MKKNPGSEFFEATKYQNMTASAQEKNTAQPPLETPYEGNLIALPDPETLSFNNIALKTAIAERKSHRKYLDEPLELDELSYVLWATQGIKSIKKSATFRTVPSAGARHAFETYLLINNVNDLKSGLYRYIASKHALICLDDQPDSKRFELACLGQPMISTGAVSFFWVADIKRMTYRYDLRGYRYILLDAGHVCQNLYLAAGDIDAGVVAIAAYDDDALNQALALDGESLFVTYVASLGKI